MVLDESKGLERDEIIKAVGSTNTGVAMVMSRASFQSLVQCHIDPMSTRIIESKIQSSVEDLEELIEGYSNAFNEDLVIDISSKVVAVSDIFFDETFNNIALKMSQQHQFSNPYEPKW